MLESGSSGSVRGASSNGRPYREPGPFAPFNIGLMNGQKREKRTSEDGAAPAATFEPLPL